MLLGGSSLTPLQNPLPSSSSPMGGGGLPPVKFYFRGGTTQQSNFLFGQVFFPPLGPSPCFHWQGGRARIPPVRFYFRGGGPNNQTFFFQFSPSLGWSPACWQWGRPLFWPKSFYFRGGGGPTADPIFFHENVPGASPQCWECGGKKKRPKNFTSGVATSGVAHARAQVTGSGKRAVGPASPPFRPQPRAWIFALMPLRQPQVVILEVLPRGGKERGDPHNSRKSGQRPSTPRKPADRHATQQKI